MKIMNRLMREVQDRVDSYAEEPRCLCLVDKFYDLNIRVDVIVEDMSRVLGVHLSESEIANIETIGDLIMVFHTRISAN